MNSDTDVIDSSCGNSDTSKEQTTLRGLELYPDVRSFQEDILLVIGHLEVEDKRTAGADIKSRYEQEAGEPIAHGRLYPNLDSLNCDGLINKGTIDRRTNKYTLTESGREYLRQREQSINAAILSTPVEDGGHEVFLGPEDADDDLVTDGGVRQERQLTKFQLVTLFEIRGLHQKPGDVYGLGIKRALESYYGEEINHGRLYPNLDELVELGYLQKKELDKRTNEYLLTSEGERILINEFAYFAAKLGLDVDAGDI